MPLNALAEFGLKERRGALVSDVNSGGPAAKAGIEPGDVIVEFNGKPIQRRDQLVSMVVATKPGTTVPVKVLRDKQERSLNVTVDELDLEDETDPRGRDAESGCRSRRRRDRPASALQLGPLTSDMARRLRLPAGHRRRARAAMSSRQSGAARRHRPRRRASCRSIAAPVAHAAGSQPGAQRRCPSGGTAFLLVLRDGQQRFVTIRKD